MLEAYTESCEWTLLWALYTENDIVQIIIFKYRTNFQQNSLKIVGINVLYRRLTIPEPCDELVLATDASKIAASAVLYRVRNGKLELVACNSKYFSVTDLNKCSYVLEAIALGYGLKTYALVSNQVYKPGFCIRRRSGTHVIPTLARGE